MKNQLILLATTAALLLASCGGEAKEGSTNETTGKSAEEAVSVVVNYTLNVADSEADWERTLDQKPTKQKVQLFGQMVDVDLGPVKLNSNGSVTIKEGKLTITDDALTEANIVFDMASFKFAKEKGNGLFDVKNHPNSTLVLNNFSDGTAKGQLTIQGTSKKMDVTVSANKTGKGQTLKGSFVVNTLDFPLRDKVTAKDINKDEIEVTFEFVYLEE